TTDAEPRGPRTIPLAKSLSLPPTNVPYVSVAPSAVSLATKASRKMKLLIVVSNAPGVTGKSLHGVDPAIYAAPDRSSAQSSAGCPDEKASDDSSRPASLIRRSNAPGLVGKSADIVSPVRWIVPSAASRIAVTWSKESPPRNVLKTSALPSAESSVTNPSQH